MVAFEFAAESDLRLQFVFAEKRVHGQRAQFHADHAQALLVKLHHVQTLAAKRDQYRAAFLCTSASEVAGEIIVDSVLMKTTIYERVLSTLESPYSVCSTQCVFKFQLAYYIHNGTHMIC